MLSKLPSAVAARLKAAGTQISNNVNAATKVATSGNISVGGVITPSATTTTTITAGNGLTSAQQNAIRSDSLKLPNPLEKFASFNYIFTLGCLSGGELAFPDLTYRKTDPSVVIIRSGGGPLPGSATLYEKSGKIEYFIDDVEIETIIASNPATRVTNATSIRFKVTEPYSMGLFLQALQVSAKRQGYSSYIEAPYLLTVDFKGYDDAGNYVRASPNNLRRMFPLKFVNIEFDVTESGSGYTVEAIPYHEIALTDETQKTQTDVNFTGSTVSEMLQTGENSLTRILNDRALAGKTAGKVKKANQYIIMFPTAESSKAEYSFLLSGSQEQLNDSATTREFTDAELQRYYESSTGDIGGKLPVDYKNEIKNIGGISVKRSSIGENIREYADNLANINDIGKSTIVKSRNDSSKRPMPSATRTQDENNKGEIDRCQVCLPGDVRQGTFKAGKKIQTIIEEIIISSEYGRKIASKKPNEYGMIPWFRVETQVFNADSTPNTVAISGVPARIFVYRVIPYMVHLSKFQGATENSPGIVKLKTQAAKEYNYIYTGKNKDILDFDIKFNAAFFTSISGDLAQTGVDAKNSVRQETILAGKNVVPGVSPGIETGDGSGKVKDKVIDNNSVPGGVGMLHPESQVARDFNEALVSSPVDLVAVDLKILGDPYYICDSGMGNYNAPQISGVLNITQDGTMNYQNGEVDIEINFRTPLDYGPTGYMDFPGGGTAPVAEFSGLYQVLFVNNVFSNGQFTQTLQTIRRPKQDSSNAAPAQSTLLNTNNANPPFTAINNVKEGLADTAARAAAKDGTPVRPNSKPAPQMGPFVP